jgi:hypothetical protein
MEFYICSMSADIGRVNLGIMFLRERTAFPVVLYGFYLVFLGLEHYRYNGSIQ